MTADIISKLVSDDKIYNFLDKVVSRLQKNKKTDSSYQISIMHEGKYVRTKILKHISSSFLIIDTDTAIGEVIITYMYKGVKPHNIALLNKDNSEECSRYCAQMIEEENKISQMLDDFIEELLK